MKKRDDKIYLNDILEYFGVLPITIYQTIKGDLPIVKEQIEKLLNDIK